MQRALLLTLLAVGLLACDTAQVTPTPPPTASKPPKTMKNPANGTALTQYSKGLSDYRLKAILALPDNAALTNITAPNNLLTAKGVQAIVDAPCAATLTNLVLNDNAKVGDAGLEALASATHMTSLERLQLSNTGATASGAGALAQAKHLGGLKELRLMLNPLGDTGAKALTGTQTELLDLRKAEIGGAGARALIESAAANSINLSENPLGPGGLKGLSAISPTLRALFLDRANLGPDDIRTLTTLPAPKLKILSLKDNAFDDDTLAAIAKAPWFAQLDSLDLIAHTTSKEARRAIKAAWGDRDGLTVFSKDL